MANRYQATPDPNFMAQMEPRELHQAAHVQSDVDSGPFAQHHTIGPGAGQAAPGDLFYKLLGAIPDGVNTSTDIAGITSTSFVESDTECRVTMPTPPSGIIVVNWGFRASNNTANEGTRMSVEVATGSFGGTILSGHGASTLRMAEVFNSTVARVSHYSQIYKGLPVSSTLFIRCMYSVSGGTGAITDRTFSVQP